ncbi:hypothetical protein CROQUDRAFT_656726 [Cronartium quercuum f. sp. fusiforme G11]|uniref:Uncharacterized protein n=1 Tax=Cronartium quercuum f. sp. fusiforme G11 TaxID=708437 RepID=A0A9P6TDN5_9BASI|nr:hypothetical protein CROQUDRAFT_656726 [Cronartium quercuum f. sp. fusiforme G11]
MSNVEDSADDVERFFIIPRTTRCVPETMSALRAKPKDRSTTDNLAKDQNRRPTRGVSPTASSSSECNIWDDTNISSDEDGNDVTASQVDRYSMANLLKRARSPKDIVLFESPPKPSPVGKSLKDIVIPESPPVTSPFDRLPSKAVKKKTDLRPGNAAQRRSKKSKAPLAEQSSNRCVSPETATDLPSVINTSGSRSTTTSRASKTTDSTTSRRHWSIPARPREKQPTAAAITSSAGDSTLPTCPSTPSRTTNYQARSLMTPETVSASSSNHQPPSPITRPALEPFRPSPPIGLCSPPSTTPNRRCIFSTQSHEKGKGRQIDITPPVSPCPEEDFSRVLVPDSSDTPEKDRTFDGANVKYSEPEDDYDLLGPSDLDFDFEHLRRIQDEAEEDERFGYRPPSPNLSPIGPSSRFFEDHHLLASQESHHSCPSTPHRQSPPAPTESAKRKKLLNDLGFGDEDDVEINLEENNAGPPSSSPIEIVQGPKPSTSKIKLPSHTPKRLRRDLDEDDEDDEITIIRRRPDSIQAHLSETDQLRDIVRKMAGLDKGKNRGGNIDDEVRQTEAWEAILSKQQKKAETAAKFSKKKTWLNRPIWKARRKSRGGGRAKGGAKKK